LSVTAHHNHHSTSTPGTQSVHTHVTLVKIQHSTPTAQKEGNFKTRLQPSFDFQIAEVRFKGMDIYFSSFYSRAVNMLLTGNMLTVETFEMRTRLLSLFLAKPRQSAEVILKTCPHADQTFPKFPAPHKRLIMPGLHSHKVVPITSQI
jgi:hypothetical protein